MTVSRPTYPIALRCAAPLCLAGLLAVLGGCAGGATSTAPSASVAPGPTASSASAPTPAAPATTAAAPAESTPPQHLTATQINEKCWMRTETGKVADLDKRMKLVDKCVDEMTKKQKAQ